MAPLDIGLQLEVAGWAGFGEKGKVEFWFGVGEAPRSPMHCVFLAEDREIVDRFHAAAIAAGAKDNGAPGPKPQYHVNCYGAFVIDPDGHNIEAVCHGTE